VCFAGRHPFYGVEVGSDRRLFDRAHHGSSRTPNNFHATWQDATELSSGTTYTLAADVWRRLLAADRLYYRLISSASRSSWSDAIATTADTASDDAPFIQIVDAFNERRLSQPFIQSAPIARRSGAPPTFITFSGAQAGYAVEVATQAALLSDALHSERRRENFFATWQIGGLLTAPAYTLPDDVWSVLSTARRLYYRLLTSARSNAWVEPQATTRDDDAARAPYVEVAP
jgi:hypothetical protein